MTKIALFGLGYTGQYLYNSLSSKAYQILGYSRKTQIQDSHIFNAEKIEEVHKLKILWNNNSPKFAIITFPPDLAHPDFWTLLEETVPYRLLLGTTGSYVGGGVITEQSPLHLNHPRLAVEERFVNAGGVLVRLSGIYGVGRNPETWLIKSSQAAPEKQLNLIHIRDIGKFVSLWLSKPTKGEVFNLSDGQTHTWGKIAQIGVRKGLVPPSDFFKRKIDEYENRFITPEKVWKTYPEMNFEDFSEYLENQPFGE